jgi:peptidase E
LKEAARAGKVLCGLSAGGVCWFETSWSDYPMIEGKGGYAPLSLLHILPGWVCPHADEPGRTDGLKEALSEEGSSCL